MSLPLLLLLLYTAAEGDDESDDEDDEGGDGCGVTVGAGDCFIIIVVWTTRKKRAGPVWIGGVPSDAQFV